MSLNSETRGRRSKGRLGIATAAGLALFLILPYRPVEAAETVKRESEALPVAKPHEQLECKDCHKSHSMIPPARTGRPCVRCHEDQMGDDSHPTGVAPEGEVPEDLPLSLGGKITCITCHVLHETESHETESRARSLLRKKFSDLCMSCHFRHMKTDSHSHADE